MFWIHFQYLGSPNSKEFMAVYAAWQGHDPCHGRWQRWSCVFGIQDLPLLTTRRELFVNKLEEHYQPLALECLEQWHYYKRHCSFEVDLEYYKNLSFVQQKFNKK